MPVHIIIDGYNFIRQSNYLSKLDNKDIELGREALIDILAIYKRYKSYKITIVFDGTHQKIYNNFTFGNNKDLKKGIEILFSKRGETADEVIKKIVLKEREQALIVSSDNEIINFSISCKACFIKSKDFEKKIASFLDCSNYSDCSDCSNYDNYDNKEYFEEKKTWNFSTKKKGSSRKLSKKDRQNKIKINKL